MAGRKVIGIGYERALREAEAEGQHPHGFYVTTTHGTMHVNGDPRMSDETLDAITHVALLARAWVLARGHSTAWGIGYG